VQEDGPLRERRIERGFEFLQPFHRAKPPLRVRVRERVCAQRGLRRHMVLQAPTGGEIEQSLRRFVRERREQSINARFVGSANHFQPLARYAHVQQVIVR